MAMINQIPKISFWAALIVTLYFALSPAPPVLVANDKSPAHLGVRHSDRAVLWGLSKNKMVLGVGNFGPDRGSDRNRPRHSRFAPFKRFC